jgi:uncharacterized protein
LYPQLSTIDTELQLDTGPSELHGILCGQLCLGMIHDTQQWLMALAGEELPQSALVPYAAVLQSVITEIMAQFSHPETGFYPLLPPENKALAQRVIALGEWCQGFLFGLGLGGLREQWPRLSGESQEFVHDLSQITRIESGAEANETDESDFTELVEYVRIGVLLLWEDLSGHNPTIQ